MRKIITLGIMLLFLGMTISSTGFNLEKQSTVGVITVDDEGDGEYTSTQGAVYSANEGDIFGLQGHIAFNYNVDDFLKPIPPLSGSCSFVMNVSYRVSGLFANILIFLLKRWRNCIGIELSVDDVPEWAWVGVSPNYITPMIGTKWKSEGFRIQISLNENAPAYEISYFKLKAKSISVKGPFRMLTWINDAEHVEEIPFVPGYFPIINVNPENNYLETPPGEITNLTILIENLGNGLTSVNAEVIQIPSDDWWCYIQPETVLNIGESKNVSFFIIPPGNFSGYETIRLSFTPSYFYDPTQQGSTQIHTITVQYNP